MRNPPPRLLACFLVLALLTPLAPAQPVLAAPAAERHDDGPSLWERVTGLFDAGEEGLAREDSPGALATRERPLTGKPLAPPRRVKELAGERTASSRTWQLADGRRQVELSAAPMNYQDAAGTWRPIDTTVRPSSQPGFVAANRSNTFASQFGARSDRLARFQLGKRHLTLGLSGEARRLQPRVQGDTVTFPDAAGGADLRYQVTATALKEEIVLERPPAEAAFTFTVRLGGVDAVPRPDGSIAFHAADSDGRPLFTMPRPFMTDARPDAESPLGVAWSDKVTQTVTRHGHDIDVTIRADEDWLRSPERRYPVVIDPTIKIQPTPTQSQDVMIGSDAPTTNFDGNWRLSVGTTNSSRYRALVKFPLTGVPAGTELDSAQLQLYYDQTHTTFANNVQIEARRVTTAWDESTATWNSINTAFAEQGANVELVDNGDAGKTSFTGDWPFSTSTLRQHAIDDDYQFNKNTPTGETYTWVPRLTESGSYRVEAHYVPASDRTTVPYTVHHSGGTTTVNVNQTAGSGGVWASLGTRTFSAGTSHKVVLKDVADPTKAAIADAVRFTKPGVDVKRGHLQRLEPLQRAQHRAVLAGRLPSQPRLHGQGR